MPDAAGNVMRRPCDVTAKIVADLSKSLLLQHTMHVARSALVIPVLRHAGEDLRDLNLVAVDAVEMLMSHATLQFGAFRTMTQIYRISRCKSDGLFSLWWGMAQNGLW